LKFHGRASADLPENALCGFDSSVRERKKSEVRKPGKAKMALKPCRECGEQISTEAKTCPNRLAPNRDNLI
jgi:hypothetical protein